jgi:hypothetical protein
MDVQIYSKHFANDGKWSVEVTILEEKGFEAPDDLRSSLRIIIDKLYNEAPATLARTMLEEVMGAVKVEARTLWGPTVIAKRI